MALTWDLTDIKDYKEICWNEDDSLNGVTEALIFATMAVGIGQIKEDNWKEFAARIKVIQALSGSFLVGPDGPKDIEAEDVKRHIGLRCNVTFENRTKFYKRIGSTLDTIKRGLKDE